RSGNIAWQSARGKGRTDETLRQSQLIAKGNLVIQAADGIVAEVPEINEQTVSQTIDAMVEADPDLAWLKEMEARGDIDWRRVKEIHDSWEYEQSGLGGGLAMAVAIVAAATGQYYVGPLLGTGAVAAAGGAAVGSLAGTAAVSAINNRGDLGDVFDDTFSSDSLRSAATAAVSAGVTKGVMGKTTTTGLNFSNAGDIARFAGQRAAQTAIHAGVSTAIEGGSLSDNLEAGLDGVLTEVVAAVLFDAVGDYAKGHFDHGSPQKIALHALAGGAVAEATGGDFRTGALAAGANEALVEHLAELVNDDPQLLVVASQITGIIAAELTDGDVNQGAEIAGYSTQYNYLSHQKVDEVKNCLSGATCSSEEQQEKMLAEAEQLSQMLDEEMNGLCQQNPTSDACRTAINAATQYAAMRDAWAVMKGDVSRSSRNLFDNVYNSDGAEDRFSLYYNTIDNRADFFGASDRYEQNLGAGAKWFGGAKFVSRARWTGLGAKEDWSDYTFPAGALLTAGWHVGDIYDWRAEAGETLMQGGFDNFRTLYNNPEADSVAWDINQLKNEQRILQPIHEAYLEDRDWFAGAGKWATDSDSYVTSRFLRDDMKQMSGGVDILDYDSRIEYGCKLLGYDAAQGCSP
ncbi:DUF637 domain-containing protein, partial [Litchfieldella qijiaojingensis]|uniref:DUF637 domain-containing protein n=1 Tax=Litchfieldella qijiaojingensis TaxID=980347 RepID=UPI00167432F3